MVGLKFNHLRKNVSSRNHEKRVFSHGMVPWIFWGEKNLHGKALIFNELRKNRRKSENNSCKPGSCCHVSPVASEQRNQQSKPKHEKHTEN